jgi:signal transduction histidine kinase
LKKRHTLFGKLLVIFFSAGIAIVLAWMISHHYLADQPYQKSFNRNIITYTRLIADKMRFDPLTKTVIEKAAGVKIITNRQDIIQTIVNKNLHFKPLTSYISVTKPGRTFYVKYENNYEFFLIRVIDQHFHPEKIDAIIVALIIALIILFLAYRKVQNVFKPMDRIQNMAIEYGKGRFDESLPVEGDGQLAQLTISINNLVVRIKSMLNAKRDLLLAIGHELKTPLSRLRIQVEMLEGDNSSLIENINEMKTIIDQLLEAEKVSHHSDLNKEMLDLNNFIKQYEDDPRIDVSTDEPFDLEFDPIRLDLAIKNIVNNAKKYAPIDSIIKIQLTTASKELWITDVGPGVSDDTISMLTDAFYRPDESRCRDDGGVGLGLYLVKNIVEAHRAELIFINMKPGLRVVIKF